jgi:hypothetical protein
MSIARKWVMTDFAETDNNSGEQTKLPLSSHIQMARLNHPVDWVDDLGLLLSLSHTNKRFLLFTHFVLRPNKKRSNQSQFSHTTKYLTTDPGL